jgi:tripartite-type tricarboxylate transporter receptor subunit TctC
MTMTPSTTRRRALAAAALLLGCGGPALAQEAWPTKPVRMIVPFAPGGSTDVVARMVGQRLSTLWNQPVVIENRAGAGGNVGADVVAKAAGDGHTLLMASGSVTINPALYKKMPFDTKKDLLPITNVAQGPMLVVVQDGSPHRTLKDLIAAAKAKPGTINFASAGVQMMVGNFAAASALLGPNRLRALAVTSKQRVPQQPELPTAHEAGLPNFENIGWFGLFAPAGTPPAVIQKVQRDVAQVMAETEIKARLYVQGMTPVVNSTADFTRQIDQELERWVKVVAARKLQAN